MLRLHQTLHAIGASLMPLTGAEKAHRYRERRRGLHVQPLRIGHPPRSRVDFHHLDVTCWCEAAIVRVPRASILAGLTDTCGARDCKQPEAA